MILRSNGNSFPFRLWILLQLILGGTKYRVDSFALLPNTMRVAKSLTPTDTKKLWKASFLQAAGETEEDLLETQRLQTELDKLVQEPPMFAGYDPNLVDESKIPVGSFTATLVLIGSLIFTYYLFDVGINGFPEGLPDDVQMQMN